MFIICLTTDELDIFISHKYMSLGSSKTNALLKVVLVNG